MRYGRVVFSCWCLVTFSWPAFAQDCGVWLPGPKHADFASGMAPLQFVVHGSEIFARIQNDTTPLRVIELWRFDGHDWILMPWDRDAMGEPDAITFENNQLAVAARRLSAQGGGNFELKVSVHTWNGTSWQEFGNLTESYPSCTGIAARLFDICFFSNAWYVAGEITGPCVPIDFVDKILPGESVSIGEVASSNANNNLETFNNGVYWGGSFASIYHPDANVTVNAANIAVWNGTAWQDVSGGVDGEVVNMTLWQENPSQPLSTQLVVAGKFTHAGAVSAAGIATRSQAGHWNALGTGVSWPPDLPFGGTWHGPAPITFLVNSPTDADLIVGGLFSAGGNFVDDFARWTGSAWEALGVGLNSTITTAVNYDNEVVAGGFFSGQGSGNVILFRVGRFDGNMWHTLSKDGTDGTVRSLWVEGGVVYAGGDFTSMDGVSASHIAARVNGEWQAMSSGVNGPVHAIASFGGEIVAGGSFSQAGGIPVQNVAAWNGSTWRTLGTGLDALVEGLAVWNNQLVAVGEFQTDDGQSTSLPGVAVWNGFAWVQLHEDVDATEAHAVAVHNGELYLGGGLDGGVVRFTGSQLEIVGGTGVSGGSVYALASLAGSLYIGGDFLSPQSWIVRWTGSQFLPLTNNGGSANFAGDVRTLTRSPSELFVGGNFEVTTGKGPTTRTMARWNGVVWRALADAFPDGRVYAAAIDGDRILAGGEFLGISNGTVSAYVAERSPSPAFVGQPAPQHLCTGDGTETSTFEAAIVPQAGAQFRWQKDGGNVNDDLHISGATTTSLSIFGILPDDAGEYRLRVTDACGTVAFSDTAPLDFTGCCPGDLNNNDAVDLVDADLFVDCLAGPSVSASCPNAARAKFDGDADVDLRDAAAFQRSFAAACP